MAKTGKRMVMPEEYAGKKFGRLTIIGNGGLTNEYNGFHRPLALVKCDCGTIKTVRLTGIVNGRVLSCGCLKNEMAKARTTKHGMFDSPEYGILKSMRRRCYCPKSAGYNRYGGRGIRICRRWLGENGFINFLADMGRRPSPAHSIDRINNDGNYEPSNCRWATPKEQANNNSLNVLITYNGKTQSMMKWSEELSMSYNTLRFRIKRGVPPNYAITHNFQQYKKLQNLSKPLP